MTNTYQKLFQNNRKWVAEKLEQDPEYFQKLAKGQSPKYLFLGCSDSRVPANEITGTGPGEMFIHRNIANMALPSDGNFMSVLQYAVEVLKVEHIIVCGHYGCGGIAAALEGSYSGPIEGWLSNIRDVSRIHQGQLEHITDPAAKLRKMVELNVREQVYKISGTSIVERALQNGARLQVHGWVYDIAEGLLWDMEIKPGRPQPHPEATGKVLKTQPVI